MIQKKSQSSRRVQKKASISNEEKALKQYIDETLESALKDEDIRKELFGEKHKGSIVAEEACCDGHEHETSEDAKFPHAMDEHIGHSHGIGEHAAYSHVTETSTLNEPKKLQDQKSKQVLKKEKTPKKKTVISSKPKGFQPHLSKEEYFELLNQVIDPEVGIGIVDMGLIYDIQENVEGIVTVTMTLTSMGCPAGPQLTTDIDGVLRLQNHITDVQINIVWEPAWSPDLVNPKVREMLWGY